MDVVELVEVQGCCSIVMIRVLVLPVAAKAMRLVGTPGIKAGAKLTIPSRAEVAVAV